jgi:hypothetical protein
MHKQAAANMTAKASLVNDTAKTSMNGHRRTFEATHGVRVFLGGMVVVLLARLTIHGNRMNMPMTVIEVSIGQSLTPLTLIAIQSKTICNHPHLRRMLIAAIALVDAFRNIVVMVASNTLRVPATAVLHFVSHGITPIGIQRIEQPCTCKKYANGSQT